MNILLADDELLSRERLRDLLLDLGAGITVVGEAKNGLEALEMVARLRPDVVLLDINMPGLDGIRCARELASLPDGPAVIFITAHEDFALQAFEVAACDYLLKPVRIERLSGALAKAERFTPRHRESLKPQLPIAGAVREYVCAERCGEVRVIRVEEILCFHADQKYTTVRLLHEEALIEESLKSLEHEFEDRFVRIHRNALVAVARIERLERENWGGGRVSLRGLSEPLEVSRRCYPALREKLKKLGKAE